MTSLQDKAKLYMIAETIGQKVQSATRRTDIDSAYTACSAILDVLYQLIYSDDHTSESEIRAEADRLIENHEVRTALAKAYKNRHVWE